MLDVAGEVVADSRGALGAVPVFPNSLTDRELDVLSFVACGYGDKEIAATLSISSRTASHHVAAIIQKLGTTNRLQAALRAVKKGLIRLEDLP